MKKCLIIIGAGTSKNIHSTFPNGIELALWIDDHLITTKKTQLDPTYHPDCPYISPMINEAKRVFDYDIDYLDKLIDQFKIKLWAYAREHDYHIYRKDSSSISIDDLISSNFGSVPHVYNLAKQCVAYLLKGQEDAYVDIINKSRQTNDTWIESLYSKLKSHGVTMQEITTNFDFISFNYERLFEYLSCKALSRIYGVQIEFLPNLIYIYGNFGTLSEVPFEEKNDSQIFREHCYGNLKFIGERHNLLNKPTLDEYEKVLFMGFGYDRTNLTDTLSIKTVKKAKLIGMCREKTKFYQAVEKEFNISMTVTTIDEFINANI